MQVGYKRFSENGYNITLNNEPIRIGILLNVLKIDKGDFFEILQNIAPCIIFANKYISYDYTIDTFQLDYAEKIIQYLESILLIKELST